MDGIVKMGVTARSDDNSKIRVGVWIILLLLSIVFIRNYINFTQDDAYITYRYARNLANGEGFVYNLDEYVLGTSAPFYAYLLAIISKFVLYPIPQISIAINFISLWIGSVLLYELGRLKNTTYAFGLPLLYITNPFAKYSIGMETLFVILLLLAAVWLQHKQRYTLMAIVIGIAMLVRRSASIEKLTLGVVVAS